MLGFSFIPWLLWLSNDLPGAASTTGVNHYSQTTCTLLHRTAICDGRRLSAVPKALPENTEELWLNGNYIRELNKTSLSAYPKLCVLHLQNNFLEAIAPHVFSNNKDIHMLEMAGNNLHVAYVAMGEALMSLPQLKFLDLARNGLTEDMVAVLLQNITTVEYLSLAGNTMLRLEHSIFSNLHQLKELHLENNYLYEIEDGAFDHLQQLQVLNIAFNRLPCLIKFNLTQLVVLNASHNAIEWFISDQGIEELFLLETLDLRVNRLLFFPFLPRNSRLRTLLLSDNNMNFYQNLVDDGFTNMTKNIVFYNINDTVSNVTAELWEDSLHGDISSLETLDMSNNMIRSFPNGFFSKTAKLSRLRLRTNCLDSLNFTIGFIPASLYELDASHNMLSVLQADMKFVEGLQNLTNLNLSQNHIVNFPPRLFSSLPGLDTADLSFNKVAICSATSIEEPLSCADWRNTVSLKKLNLKGCGLKRLPSSSFSGTQLEHLDLSLNEGVFIDHSSMMGIGETLLHLGLGSTNIQQLDFFHSTHLQSLDFSNNSLRHLPDSLLTLNLKRLDLQDNKLKGIPQEQADILSQSLQSILLGGNPFNCCQLEWHQTFHKANVLIGDLPTLTCFDDSNRKQKLENKSTQFCRNSEESGWWYMLLFLPMCLLIITVATISIITLRARTLPSEIKRRCWRPTPY